MLKNHGRSGSCSVKQVLSDDENNSLFTARIPSRKIDHNCSGAATHDWKASKQSGLEVWCLLFDLSATFDIIDTNILVGKLKMYGLDDKSAAWIKN
jgi:hypothetical protein